MKIAVLLRGQLRYPEHGSKLFKRFITDRFPDCEFKFFVHTWPSVSSTMMTVSDNVSKSREYTPVYKSFEEIISNYLPYWQPSRLLISPDAELLKLVKNIIESNLKDTELITWWKSYCTKYDKTESERAFDYFLFPQSNPIAIKDDMFIKEHIDYDLMRTSVIMHYILGQVYSACKSYQVLRDYIDINDQSYSPDLIWSTRMDCFTWFDNVNVFADMIKYIQLEKTHIHPHMTKHMVLSKSVRANEGRTWIDDFNFFMLPDTAHAFFMGDTTVENHIEYMFNNNKHTMLDVIGINSMIPHQLWTKLGRQCVFYQMPAYIASDANIIRPNMDMSICDTTTLRDKDVFCNLCDQSNMYKWPSHVIPPSDDDIFTTYRNLSTH